MASLLVHVGARAGQECPLVRCPLGEGRNVTHCRNVPDPAHASRRRVLLVDDDADILAAWTMFLRDGFEVLHARNGREALDLLAAEPCDVIVLDLMMPVMDGAEFKREADRRGITTPVLLVSAGHDTARQARELGAAGHLVKPVDPDDLEAAIARLAH